jgi:macrolide-specific efflux system membrane fusion protein
MQIADLNQMEVDTDFPEADATKLKAGMPAAITWNALTGATAAGTVASIDPTATTSNNVVSYGVVVKLVSRPTGIRIGQSTTVVVTTASASNVLSVPTAAVTTFGNISTVTVVGKSVPTRVTIGVKGDTYTEITSGLTAGQMVKLPTVNTSGTTTNTNPFTGGGGFGGGGLGGGGFGGGGPSAGGIIRSGAGGGQ